MTGSLFKIRLHRVAITLICCGLLVVLMQGAGWLVAHSEQQLRIGQLVSASRNQAVLLSNMLSPMMQTENPDSQRVKQMLTLLVRDKHIASAAVYTSTGVLVARAGDTVSLRERLALDGKSTASQFSRQLVQVIEGKTTSPGFLRLTLDTHPVDTEARLPDYLTSLLRVLMLLSLIIGMVLAHTLHVK